MMKKIYTVFILFLVVLSAQNSLFEGKERPKIGLVLSGGGARGLAHIGVLKLIDSLQIPIDYIVGTSMGGIMGGMYAAGYTGNEIEKYTLSSDWNEIFYDKPARQSLPYIQKRDDGKFQIELGLKDFTPVIPGGLIYGQKVSTKFANLLTRVEPVTNFDELPIPFKCVTVDLITGKEVVLSKGSLTKALRATMSIPTVFSPVQWGDSLLIDGGILNNFPVDILKQMGAEIIIGVNVGTQLMPKENLNSVLSILEQTTILTDYEKQRKNTELCDILIKAELGNYTSSDFDPDKVVEIIKLGDVSAAKHKPELLELKKQLLKYLSDDQLLLSDDSQKYIVGKVKIVSPFPIDTLKIKYELGLSGGEEFNNIFLNDKISQLLTSCKFEKIKIISVEKKENSLLDLSIEVIEKHIPRLFAVNVTGNEKLPFDFVMQLLAIKAGDMFDKNLLEKQIDYMYGLGYFEKITYSIKDVRENYISLEINVEEKTFRKFKIGFRYDDEYKIVGIIGLQATNIPIPGLRGEIALQFAGLFRLDATTFYPSRTLNIPIFPYVRFSTKKVPVNIYNINSGKKIAEYGDVSTTIGAGIGFNVGALGLLKLEYNHEYMNIVPEYEGLDSSMFPAWKDNLRKLRAELSIDMLDDAIAPSSGFKIDAEIEASLKRLGSEINYYQYRAEGEFYHTVFNKHTLRFNGFYTTYNDNLPEYKYAYKGGANSFVGMNINQLAGNNLWYFRFDYIYKYKKDILLKAVFNIANVKYNQYFQAGEKNNTLYGWGLGVKFLSIIGPLEVLFSRGSQSYEQNKVFENRIYFSAGYYF